MGNRYVYYVEGECERQLISALQIKPQKIKAGKIIVYNVIQKRLPKTHMIGFSKDTTVILVFDTDVHWVQTLRQNVELLKRYCSTVKVVFLPQVDNFEEELVRNTDIKFVNHLTRSASVRNFKSDFCKLKIKECRLLLEKHNINHKGLWQHPSLPSEFSFIKNNSNQIKL